MTDDDDQPDTCGAYGEAPAPDMATPLLRPVPLAPEANRRQLLDLSRVTLVERDKIVQPWQRAKSDVSKQSSTKLGRKDLKKPRKYRPSSWFHSPITAFRRASDPLKDITSSTTERSIISAPVLNSTTNARVALTEGVYCAHTTTSRLAASPWDPNSSWVSDDPGAELAEDEFDKVQELQSPSGLYSQPEQHSGGLGKMSQAPPKRSASMNALSKVKNAVTARLRQTSDPQTYHSVYRKDKFARLGDGCRPPSPLGERLARVRAEGRNLGRDKIRVLTGHGKVRRKPVQHPGQDHQLSRRKEASSFLVDAEDSYCAGRYPTGKRHALDFSFEDLGISFTKAVNNIDFQIKRDKPSLTSLSSLSHSAKNMPARNQTSAPQSLRRLSPGPRPPLSSSAHHSYYQRSSCPTSDQLDPVRRNMGQCASRAFKFGSGRAKAYPKVYPFQTNLPSDQDSGNADRTARAQRIFSQGHSDPLASHPDLTKFVDQPLSTPNGPEMPLRGESSRMQSPTQEPDLDGLEGAPIYSPSLDKLSQYGVKTPAAAPAQRDSSSRELHASSSRMRLLETPTRPGGSDDSLGHNVPSHNRSLARISSNDASRAFGQQDKNHSPRLHVTKSLKPVEAVENQPERAVKPKEQNVTLRPD